MIVTLDYQDSQSAHIETSLDLMRRACENFPENLRFRLNYADALLNNDNPDQAILIYEDALKIDPENERALFGSAKAHSAAGDAVSAADRLVRIVLIHPDQYASLFNAGAALYDAKNYTAAIGYLKKASSYDCATAQCWRILGMSYASVDKYQPALGAFYQSLRIDPVLPQTWFNLGNTLRDTLHFDDAVEAYRQALEVCPDYVEALANLAELHQSVGNTSKACSLYRKALELDPHNQMVVSNMLLALNYSGECSAKEMFTEARKLTRAAFYATTRYVPKLPGSPLKIGYVSPDFRDHPVATFLKNIIRDHCRANFTVYCYSATDISDEITEEIKGYADEWHDITAASDTEVASMIAAAGIDILVDCAGHTRGNRLGVFSYRPAPVQISYCGYPNTTGIEGIDYRFTDSVCDPPDAVEFYSEKLIRLDPIFLCYPIPADLPPITQRPQGESVVFGSFNNCAKISPLTVEVWAHILKQVPHSTLLLKHAVFADPAIRENMIQRFLFHEIAEERIQLLPACDTHHEHLSVYNEMDIALDTMPYSGTTTTCEALSMGTPLITLYGGHHVSRVSASILSAVGVPELISYSRDQYIQSAVELACNPERITQYKRYLRTQLRGSELCDSASFIRKIEYHYSHLVLQNATENAYPSSL